MLCNLTTIPVLHQGRKQNPAMAPTGKQVCWEESEGADIWQAGHKLAACPCNKEGVLGCFSRSIGGRLRRV